MGTWLGMVLIHMYNEGSIKADYENALAQHFNEETHTYTAI